MEMYESTESNTGSQRVNLTGHSLAESDNFSWHAGAGQTTNTDLQYPRLTNPNYDVLGSFQRPQLVVLHHCSEED